MTAEQNPEKKTIVLAAGGTGGHIFPAESLAAEVLGHGHTAVLVTDVRYKKRADTPEAMQVKTISAASPGSGVVGKCKALPGIALGFLQARKLLKLLRPSVVVGFGGYPSFPTMLAAKTLGLPMVIHEQNAVLGRVNRVIAPWTQVVATSFHSIAAIREEDRRKIVFTGNPVRQAIRAVSDLPYPVLNTGEHLQILVTGGSQGAAIFSDLVPEAIISLPDELRGRIRIDQQCRAEDIERVRQAYKEAGVNANLATFFEDMPTRLAAAHLVIARAGASTVAELCVAGRPAILIPYMYAMDDHQTANARALAEKGAAFVLHQKEVVADDIARKIKDCLLNADMLEKMAASILSEGVPDATQRLAQAVLR